MTYEERRLFAALLGALAERFTKAGHVMRQIAWEHRGHCPPVACCLRCQTYAALLIEASELLEADMARARIANDAGTLFGEPVTVDPGSEQTSLFDAEKITDARAQ